jgi:hypothetical protein
MSPVVPWLPNEALSRIGARMRIRRGPYNGVPNNAMKRRAATVVSRATAPENVAWSGGPWRPAAYRQSLARRFQDNDVEPPEGIS